MSNDTQESLSRLLLEYTDQMDYNLTMDMLESAQRGLTEGASDFADKITDVIAARELADYLRCYPLAHALIGLTKFNELNKNTEISRKIMTVMLDLMDEVDRKKKTLH